MNNKVLPPKAMTTSELKAYLQFAAELAPIENNPIILGTETLGNVKFIDWRIVLFYELKRNACPMTASELMAHLESNASGRMWDEHDYPIRHNKQDIVNAFVMDEHVILQTFNDMLEMEGN